LIDEALARAGRTPVLAQDVLAEQIALAGGRTWIGNPLDAFRRTDQRVYLDWLQGRDSGGLALQHAPRVVLVRRHTRTAKKMAAASTFAATASDGEAVLYIRRR
jgi:hypothetical protein